MKKLLEKVEEELKNISEKGLTSSNLDTTYKLIDIYKDIAESKYYKTQTEGEYDRSMRDSRGRYTNSYDHYWDGSYDRGNRGGGSSYNHYSPMKRYIIRMEDGLDNYDTGRERYRSGDSQDRLLDGLEMMMGAVCSFVDELNDYAETPQEKEVIRKHLNKMKNV